MTARQFSERLSNVDDRYLLSAQRVLGWGDAPAAFRTRRAGKMRRILILAAVLCILLTLSAAAFAANWFGLRDMLLPRQEVEVPLDPETEDPASAERKTYLADVISLSGYANTPESRANAEWQAFLNSYDTDGAIIDSLGNSIFGAGTGYSYYQVYTQEMAEKLDEIAAKYGLKLHTGMLSDLYTDEALCDQVGGDFLGENRAYSSYVYEDGTFKFDGEIELADYGLLDYQFQRCVRGSFSDMILNIGDVTDYREWVYATKSGVPVTLALAPRKALVLADLPDCFVTVNVLAGTETPADDVFSAGAFDAEDLERFSDSFDFSALTPVRPADPELSRPTLEEALGKPSTEEFFLVAGLEEAAAQAFYAELFRDVENGDRGAVAGKILYPAALSRWQTSEAGTCLVEHTVESAEEFLLYYDDIFTESLWDNISQNQYTPDRADLVPDNGMVGGAGGAIWFAGTKDGGIKVFTIQNEEGCSIRQP